jgi:hypothetical protein
MKKTIVAAAIAAVVAAPAAFAEVSISGGIYLEAGVNGQGDNAQDEVFSDIFFKASEDLGNGMKVATTIQLQNDNSNGTNNSEGTKTVSVSGDFGTIEGGYMEAYTESMVTAMAANDPAHTISNEVTEGNFGFGAGHRYTSPSIMGLKVGAEAMNAGPSTLFAEYSNGPLLVRVAEEKNSADATSVDGATVNPEDITSIAVKYTIDGLTLAVVDTDDASGDSATWYGASYTMGNITLAASTVNGGATDGDNTLSASYALSKRTNAYIATFQDDTSGSSNADETVVGIKHSF